MNALLPLVMLLNARHVGAVAFDQLRRRFLHDDHCWPLRLESSWNGETLMVWLLEVMRKSLADVLDEYSICLVLDVCSCHVVERVITKAARSGVQLLFVPAGTTSLLQPLDVCVFAQFKHALAAAFERLGHESADGHVRSDLFVALVFEVGKHVFFAGDWSWAFRKCGFGDSQKQISNTLKLKVPGIVSICGVQGDLPSLADLRAIWPGRRTIPLGWLFHWCTAMASNTVPDMAPDIEFPVPDAVPNPWFGRLRSSSSRNIGSSQPAQLSAAAASTEPWRPRVAKAKPASKSGPQRSVKRKRS